MKRTRRKSGSRTIYIDQSELPNVMEDIGLRGGEILRVEPPINTTLRVTHKLPKHTVSGKARRSAKNRL